MDSMRKFFILLAAIINFPPLWATDTIINEYKYEYNFESVNIGSNPNQGEIVTVFDSLQLNGINVAVSGWADSGKLNSDDIFNYDRVIGAELKKVFDDKGINYKK